MTTARLYVDGETWEIMGNVVDSFLPFTNSLTASRSGKLYNNSEAKPKMLKVDEIKVTPDEFLLVEDFFKGCSGKRFNLTIAYGEDCDDGFKEWHYMNCLISGDPEFSHFENKITGFELGYEEKVPK